MPEGLITFKAEVTGIVFQGSLESEDRPRASYFQWVHGLPDALCKPYVQFHTTDQPDLWSLTVGDSVTTPGTVVKRVDGAVLCQITRIITQSAVAALATAYTDLDQAAKQYNVRLISEQEETP